MAGGSAELDVEAGFPAQALALEMIEHHQAHESQHDAEEAGRGARVERGADGLGGGAGGEDDDFIEHQQMMVRFLCAWLYLGSVAIVRVVVRMTTVSADDVALFCALRIAFIRILAVLPVLVSRLLVLC